MYTRNITLLLFLMSWKELPLSDYKSTKIRDISLNNHGLYFDLQFNTSALLGLRNYNSFPKLVHFLSEPIYMRCPIYLEIVFSLSSCLME